MYGFLILAEWRLNTEIELFLEARFMPYSHVCKDELFYFFVSLKFFFEI